MLQTSVRAESRYIGRKIRSILYNYRKKESNIFNTNFDKDVLISYILPIDKPNENPKHPNEQEVQVIVDTFKKFRYNVDIYHYKYSDGPINYKKYDVLFGFGEPFDNSFYHQCTAKRIYYATGAHVFFQNTAEMNRILKLQKRKGKLLKPRRVVPKTWSASTSLSDAILALGNDFTVSTYERYFDGPIFNIPVSSYNFHPKNSLDRDAETAKNSFLWFGSSGLVHKGLDLVLDAFSKCNDKHLHVCGPEEEDFFEVYRDELFHRKNIHYHGWVDVSSNEFKEIVQNCYFSIFPSCSEGQASSLITTMKTGLIPIATESASVDLRDFGFLIERANVDPVLETIDKVSNLPTTELENKSQKSFEYSVDVHSIENFHSEFESAIEKIITD